MLYYKIWGKGIFYAHQNRTNNLYYVIFIIMTLHLKASFIHSFIQLIKILLLSRLRTSHCVNCIRNSRMNEACNISSEYFRTYKCWKHLDKLPHITFTMTLQNKPIIPSVIVSVWKFYGE